MVTLTGAGGAGKTRLALHAAACMLEQVAGGAWLADLSAVVDPALVPKTLAAAMQLPEQPVRLFAERAAAVRPSFTLDASTLPGVVALCRRLDGLPLAIELAAARCRAMSPAEIAVQLADRFGLLSAGRRGALPRQRTLE